MTPQEMNEVAVQMAKVGKSAADITKFLVDNHIIKDVAEEAASILVSSLVTKPSLPIFNGRTLLKREIDRLNSMFEAGGFKLYDLQKIWSTVLTWADVDDRVDAVTQNLLLFWKEEYEPMDFPTGTRVKGGGYDNPHVIVKYGEVIVNHFPYLAEQNPYKGLKPAPTPEQLERLKMLSQLIAVQWYDENGTPQCVGFHTPDTLTKVPE